VIFNNLPLVSWNWGIIGAFIFAFSIFRIDFKIAAIFPRRQKKDKTV